MTAAIELGIVYLMTVKPDLSGSLVGLSVALGLISAAPRWRGTASALPEGAGTPAER